MFKIRHLFLGLISLAVVSAALGEDRAENPHYTFWAKWKVGTVVQSTMTTERDGPTRSNILKDTLVEVKDDHVTINSELLKKSDGTLLSPAKKIVIGKFEQKPGTPTAAKLADAPTESVSTPAGDFKAKFIHITLVQDDSMMTIDQWYSDQVPGGSIKSVITSDGKVNFKSEFLLQSIDSGK